jgi:hypothetical protein
MFLPVNASLHWPNNVSCVFLSMNWRCANTEGTVAHRFVSYKILWSVQELRRLSLLDTNITPIQNNKMQPTSSFTFNPVKLYSTFDRWGLIKYAAHIIKRT